MLFKGGLHSHPKPISSFLFHHSCFTATTSLTHKNNKTVFPPQKKYGLYNAYTRLLRDATRHTMYPLSPLQTLSPSLALPHTPRLYVCMYVCMYVWGFIAYANLCLTISGAKVQQKNEICKFSDKNTPKICISI